MCLSIFLSVNCSDCKTWTEGSSQLFSWKFVHFLLLSLSLAWSFSSWWWRSGLEHSPCKWKFGCLNSQPRHTYLVKTGSDSSTAKCSAIGVSVKGPWRWPLWIDAPCHRCGTLKNPLLNGHECRAQLKIAALHRQWWHLHMSGKFLSVTKNAKQAKYL